MWKTIFMAVLTGCACVCCSVNSNNDVSEFVRVENGKFIRRGVPYYYIGTNFWYGAILGSEGEGGNRIRLCHELDSLKSLGIDNLRILVGADGECGVLSKVEPTLQVKPGVYNDTILAGLDYLLSEMKKREMLAVLYLNNSWEWSGGYGQYLEWAGCGKTPAPAVDGYEKFQQYVSRFVVSDSAKVLFANHLKYVLSRTNRYSGIAYVDDPTIMSWQIGNEPRAFSLENKEAFAQWMSETAALIKSIDKNHLVSTGSEGKWGCEMDMDLYERVHADRNVDYLNIHIWPYNWGWASKDSLSEKLPQAICHTNDYIEEHLSVANRLHKPLVLEEFGYPRDGFSFDKSASVVARDDYYRSVFDWVVSQKEAEGLLAGCNFWGWGGLAEPQHTEWQSGDDYTGDPSQEPQGLNSVFASDSTTLSVIRDAISRIAINGEK